MPARYLARLALALAVAALSALALAPAASAGHQPDAAENPCLDREQRSELRLQCPDLRMRPPFDIYVERRDGRRLLRAGNSIDSRGDGPAELNGKRVSNRRMKARQRIHRRGGGTVSFNTGARLALKHVPVEPGAGTFWKFKDAATVELWRLDGAGRRTERVVRGPKQVYCLRDLQHTKPDAKGSPSSAVYPGCSQDRDRRRVTLGTSVGWSDVYPSNYHQQWVEVDDLGRGGCFAYVHTADPRNGVYESNEHNNEASTVVRLGRSGRFRGICDRRDRAVRASQQGDGTPPPGVDPDYYPGYDDDDGHHYGDGEPALPGY